MVRTEIKLFLYTVKKNLHNLFFNVQCTHALRIHRKDTTGNGGMLFNKLGMCKTKKIILHKMKIVLYCFHSSNSDWLFKKLGTKTAGTAKLPTERILQIVRNLARILQTKRKRERQLQTKRLTIRELASKICVHSAGVLLLYALP